MTIIFLHLTVAVQVLLLVRSNDPPPSPHNCKFSQVILTIYILTIIIQELVYTAKNTSLKLPAMVISTTIQIGHINLHVIEVTLQGNFN